MGEINDDDWRNDLDISGLSLMDEDDSLLLLFPDPTTSGTTDKEDRGLGLFGDDIYNCDSSELHKYNLRKSLAWDKAFFTNAGVLEPDELCHMIESNHVGEKRLVLATIQEDVIKRSTESISTLKSDCTLETSQGCVLFEDVRASSQRSPAVSTDAAAAPDKTPSTLDDPDSHGKVKPNAIRKRPSIRAHGLGKVTNKPLGAKEHNNTSMSRPSTGLSKSVRASVDVNKTKQGEPLTISRRVRSIVSKPGPTSSKSALRSFSKNELTFSSCSSVESCISASSSSASKKSPLESVLKQKKASNSLVNGSRVAAVSSKLIGQSRVSPLSASSTYKHRRLPSNASAFLSASVDWSFNSPRAGKGAKNTVSGGSSPAIDDQQGAKHGTVSSASVTKPTGLRVPSPKLGYFDGGRSSVARTPTGSCTGGSAKRGARSLNESTTSSRTKSRFIQESTKGRPVSRSSRLIVSACASSPKITTKKKTYSKVSAEEQLHGDAVEDNLAQ